MYVPPLYKAQSTEEVKAFLQANPFGILVSVQRGKPVATHIPLMLVHNHEGKQVLWGHVSKANEQWNNLLDQEKVLAIFTGPHTYISSSWYSHENVPTWNYIAVHVYGKVRFIEGQVL